MTAAPKITTCIVTKDNVEEEEFELETSRYGKVSRGYNHALVTLAPFIDIYQTFIKRTCPPFVETDFVISSETVLQPFPSSFNTLITSYLEEGLLESALEVMDVLVRIPGFHPPNDLIEDILLNHILRSKSIRKSAFAMALMSRLPHIYPPNILGLMISQKAGPHDSKRFWQIFISEIVPQSHGKWISRWFLKYLVQVMEQDLFHCLVCGRVSKSLIARSIITSSELELNISAPIKMVMLAAKSFESRPSSDKLIPLPVTDKTVDLEMMTYFIRILDLIIIVNAMRVSMLMSITNVVHTMQKEITQHELSFDTIKLILETMRSNDARLEFIDRHGFKRFSSSKVPADKKAAKDTLLCVKKLFTFYSYFTGNSEIDHLRFLNLMKLALDTYLNLKTYRPNGDATGTKIYQGLCEDDLKLICGHGSDLFIHNLTMNLSNVFIEGHFDKKLKKDALLLIHELRDKLRKWKELLYPFVPESPRKKPEKQQSSPSDIIILE